MAGHSQGGGVSFGGGALSEVISVSANKTAEAPGDERIDVTHLGVAVGSSRLYLDSPFAPDPGDTGGDVTVEMYGDPPSAGEKGSLSVSGGGVSVSFPCVLVTSSGISLSVGEAARASVTFTAIDESLC